MYSIIFFLFSNFDSRIIVFDYYNDNNNTNLIQLNNQRYRESLVRPYQQGYFALKTNSHRLYNYPYEEYYGSMLTKENSFSDILIKSKNTKLNTISYFSENPHHVSIIALLNVDTFSNTAKIKISLKLNQKTIYQQFITKKETFSYFDTTINSPGYHTIALYAHAKQNEIWCNCLSKSNGYQNSRYLFAWTNLIEKNMSLWSNTSEYKLPIDNRQLLYIL